MTTFLPKPYLGGVNILFSDCKMYTEKTNVANSIK